jgi:ubiquinone/menaquinone biosynthesis C-methylase UbiE
MAETDDAVRDLFNAKAADWHRKYDADGPLARRIAAFEERLSNRVHAPANVLELGCGTGNLAFHLSQRGYDIHACDIAERMLEEARRAYPDAPIDWVQLAPAWTELPFADASMDAIVASSVFEYLDGFDDVLAQCRRVLKPGGVMLFTVPNIDAGVRKVEGALRLAAAAARIVPLPLWLRRADRYLQYLRLSRNRFSVAGWRDVLAQAGFRPASDGLVVSGPFSVGSHSPLLLLAFERTADPVDAP